MLMQEMSSLLQLVAIKFKAELDVDDSRPRFFNTLRHPFGLVAMDCDIQLLQHAEVRARRRAYQEVR